MGTCEDIRCTDEACERTDHRGGNYFIDGYGNVTRYISHLTCGECSAHVDDGEQHNPECSVGGSNYPPEPTGHGRPQ